MRPRELFRRLQQGHLANIRFRDAQRLAEGFGFRLIRVRGAHHIYRHPDLPAIINLQEVRGEAKAYQIRQLLVLVERYRLSLEEGNQ